MVLLRSVKASKDELSERIVCASAPIVEQIQLLVPIDRITPLTAAALLADIGDIRRLKTARKMSAYLRLVQCCHDSGGTFQPGHIIRESRKLSHTILTQSIHQTVKGTPAWNRRYEQLKSRRGAGRACIAMIRRLCNVARRVQLTGEKYYWLKEELYQRKLSRYQKRSLGRRKCSTLLYRKHSGRLIWPEPPNPESRLFKLHNVFLTPHIAGSQGREVLRQADFAIEEFERYRSR